MPYNADKPSKKVVDKIRNRHPDASMTDVKQWVHVFNEVMSKSKDDEKAHAQAWSVLNAKLGTVEDVARIHIRKSQ